MSSCGGAFWESDRAVARAVAGRLQANLSVRAINLPCKQRFWGSRWGVRGNSPAEIFFIFFIFFQEKFIRFSRRKVWYIDKNIVNFHTQHIFCQVKAPQREYHSHRDLNSVSSSTWSKNLWGPIPWSRRKPAPRVRIPPRAADSSCGGSTSLSLKPAALNSLELMIMATGSWDVSASLAGSHSSNVSPEASSSTRFNHLLMTRAWSPL